MKKYFVTALLILSFSAIAHAQVQTLPSFSLPDPDGQMHSSAQLGKNGIVVIVSAPLLHDKSAQQAWSKFLVATKGNNQASLIIIEDLAASAFQGMASSEMKKDWKPGSLPMLLVDKTGTTHSSFGVDKDTTKIFVFNKGGNLVFSDAGSPSEAAAQTVWGKLGN